MSGNSGPPSWLFSNNTRNAIEATSTASATTDAKENPNTMAKTKAEAVSAPPTQLLSLVGSFLNEHSLIKTHKAFWKEVNETGWDSNASKNEGNSLISIFKTWESGQNSQVEESDKESSDDSSDESSDESSDSSESDSSDSDSESDSEDETGRAAVVTETTQLKNNLKRKAPAKADSSSSSSSGSSDSSDSDSDSSSESDNEPRAKKRKTAKAATAKSDSESSDSDSDSSEDGKMDVDSDSSDDSSSGSDSSSDSDSSSESDSDDDSVVSQAAKVALPESDSSSDSSSDSDSDSDTGKAVKTKAKAPKDSSDTSVTLDNESLENPPLPPNPVTSGRKKQNEPFSRIPKNIKVDPRFASNEYVSMDYSQRAHEDLIVTKGKGFTKEKNKKKKGSFRGGLIDIGQKKGIYFDD